MPLEKESFPNFQEQSDPAREKAGAESLEKGREIRIDKKTLVLLVGLPASGKSTFAIEHFPLDAIVSTDRIRQELTNNPANQLISERAFILARRIVEERLQHGEIAVVDAQNLTEDTRNSFYEAAKKYGANVEAFFLNVSPEESMARDRVRRKHVGAEYIKGRRGVHSVALRSLKKSPHINKIHVVESNEANKIVVHLSQEDQEAFEADRELLKEANTSAVFITAAETGFLRKEIKEEFMILAVQAGSIIFVDYEKGAKGQAFLSSNFLPHQILNPEVIAKRLHANISDEAVFDVMKFILKERIHLNLTTVISYSSAFSFVDQLRAVVKEAEARRGVSIPTPLIRILPGIELPSGVTMEAGFELRRLDPSFTAQVPEEDVERYRIHIARDAPQDTPLFLIGDIQGCYRAMRELASLVYRENIAKSEEKKEKQRRMIVFVGDMADRGPYDAEAVIYITALVRMGRAMLIKGNHDENLLEGLKGGEVKSEETAKTVAELKRRLKPGSIQKIIEMLEKAPFYAEWEHLVAVHASLPRIPRKGEEVKEHEKRVMTYGARSGRYVGGRAEVWKLHSTVAHDPEVLVVGGHTHEEDPVMDLIAGSTILDTSVEVKGKLWGMYYPELEFASAEEPSVSKLYKILEGNALPRGEELLMFIEYARQQGFIETKRGEGEYDGLILTTYSRIAEAGNLWEKYPVLRHFRGLIIDTKGDIVARPFEKSHKAGDEIPLEKLDIIPEKVFEKANGSLAIVYFWKDKWRVATKFSFENEAYTKVAEGMLSQMNMSVLDPLKTYLFEIILPNDAHIVDYGGKQDLILLNSIDLESGQMEDWGKIVGIAKEFGVRTAEDMTNQFKGMTIAQIYEYAQQEGRLSNLEGMIALYIDKNGKNILVKVKAREYENKKFVRDYLEWEGIIEAFDKKTMEVSPEAIEKLLGYNFDNTFARAALEARIQWIVEQYRVTVEEAREFIFSPLSEAEKIFEETMNAGEGRQKAIEKALRGAVPLLLLALEHRKGEQGKDEINAFMGFLRGIISGQEKPEERLAQYALERVQKRIETETKKRGKNSFWVIPAY